MTNHRSVSLCARAFFYLTTLEERVIYLMPSENVPGGEGERGEFCTDRYHLMWCIVQPVFNFKSNI